MDATNGKASRRAKRARGGLARDERGVAAVEFAVVVPVFLLLYLGGYDLMRLVRAYDKTQVAAKSVADLVAQEGTNQDQTQAEISGLLSAAAQVAAPYNDGTFKVTVSAVDLATTGPSSSPTCCTATVRWSATQNGLLRPCNATLAQVGDGADYDSKTIPQSIATQKVVLVNKAPIWNASVIVVDVSYTVTAMTPGLAPFATRTIVQRAYAIPRTIGQVTVAPSGGSQPVAMGDLPSNQTGTICR